MIRSSYRVYSFLLVVFLVVECERPMYGCLLPATPLAGTWMLDQVTFGLTRKTVPATELSYSQTISFDGYVSNGSYQEVRNSSPVHTGSFSVVFPEVGSSKGILLYPADTTQQSFERRRNQLLLSEQMPKGATLADGST